MTIGCGIVFDTVFDTVFYKVFSKGLYDSD